MICLPCLAIVGVPAQPAGALASPVVVMERFLARVGLGGAAAPPAPAGPVALEGARQDFKHLTADLAVHTLTPLRIGDRTYRKGLGAHANGTAVFALDAPFTRFVCDVGVDNNTDTGGVRGTVVFVVKADGREVARTPTCRCGEPARRIDVPLAGVRRLELLLTDAGDGISFDQADWADARLLDAAGNATYLSDVLLASQQSPFLAQRRLPASFVYGGEPSDRLLSAWPREEAPVVERGGRRVHTVTWREPGGGLVATWRAECFLDMPAVEFRWTFANAGAQPTKPLSDVRALDLSPDVASGQARLLHSTGGLLGNLQAPDLGFLVANSPLGSATLSGAGGRSSNKDLPFFVVHAADDLGGIFVGIGWSGQWQADFGPGPDGKLAVAAAMPGMHLRIPPGETIITPAVLLGTYAGPVENGANALRRTLWRHYMPDLGGARPLPPVSWNSWFVFDNRIDEGLLEREADLAASLGMEYFCIDAGWFEGDFPEGVGNWTINTTKFPGGLGQIGRHVASKGMKLGLWFEPERVAAGTRVGREHPEWVHGDLLDLGVPAARDWVFAMMKRYIDEGHVRWIRFDFNTEPLPTWDSMDGPDTRGLAQSRHVAGLYGLLDRLRAAYPDLLIEGCASGGRRIDLETIQRSHTFWKSDETGNLPVMRAHETGGNVFLPGGLLNANLLVPAREYDVLSLFAGPLGFGADWTKLDTARRDMVRRLVGRYKEVRRLLSCDYYALFPQARDETGWIGWQFHDPDTGEGCAIVLRPDASAYSAAQIRLRGLDADRRYVVTVDSGKTAPSSGRKLADGWPVTLPDPGTGMLIQYRLAAAGGR